MRQPAAGSGSGLVRGGVHKLDDSGDLIEPSGWPHGIPQLLVQALPALAWRNWGGWRVRYDCEEPLRWTERWQRGREQRRRQFEAFETRPAGCLVFLRMAGSFHRQKIQSTCGAAQDAVFQRARCCWNATLWDVQHVMLKGDGEGQEMHTQDGAHIPPRDMATTRRSPCTSKASPVRLRMH